MQVSKRKESKRREKCRDESKRKYPGVQAQRKRHTDKSPATSSKLPGSTTGAETNRLVFAQTTGKGKGSECKSVTKEWKELHQSKSHTPKYYGEVPDRICKATRKYDRSRRKVLGIRTSPGHKGMLEAERYPEVDWEQRGDFLTAISLQQRWG